MRRFLPAFFLLIASFGLAAAVSAHVWDGGERAGGGAGEFRASLKAAKAFAAPCKLVRATAPTPLESQARGAMRMFSPPPARAARLETMPRAVRRPESMPPAPSLTGLVVIVV